MPKRGRTMEMRGLPASKTEQLPQYTVIAQLGCTQPSSPRCHKLCSIASVSKMLHSCCGNGMLICSKHPSLSLWLSFRKYSKAIDMDCLNAMRDTSVNECIFDGKDWEHGDGQRFAKDAEQFNIHVTVSMTQMSISQIRSYFPHWHWYRWRLGTMYSL